MTRTARVRPTRTRRGPHVPTLPQLMATAVEANPGGTAVVLADADAALARLGYGELDERSNRLARLLIARGIGPEDLVAVGIRRSVESVVAVWAVAKTGAGFVPVDPSYPADRVLHMVTDSGAVLGLTVADTRTTLPAAVPWLDIDTDEFLAAANTYSAEPVTNADRVRPLRAEHAAYAIYTSGSTGLPKGVVVTHTGLAALTAEMRERFGIGAESRVLHVATPSFDASIMELLMAVGAAATLVVTVPDVYGGPELGALIAREGVTHGLITPSVLASLDPEQLTGMESIVGGGEAVSPELVRRWSTSPSGNRRFFNAYGPTEATIATNISDPLAADRTVTIGAAVRGAMAHVLDERLRPVPAGAPGELYIAGALLARGYHARPELTSSRFVANPFEANGSRLYRTGDRVRANAAGELEYLGRNDFQVKIRGLRIELGEIDAVLAGDESVDFAVTIGHEVNGRATALVSYVHAAPGYSIDTLQLSELAERALPAHMVPAAIMELDEIPLTPAGKLDRRALPEPQLEIGEYRAPETPAQQAVAEVIAEVLHLDRVGLDDDFFSLGVDSITAIQIVSRARARGLGFKPREMFAARTVAALAEVAVPVENATATEELATGPLVELDAADEARLRERYPNLSEVWPLTPLQSGMLFHARLAESSVDAYMVQFALDVAGEIDVERVHAAARAMLERHVNLRAVFAEDSAGNPLQVILDDVELPWQYLDLSDREPAEALAETDRLMAFDVARHFDMGAGPLLRITLFRTAADRYRVCVTSHHILIDGWSMPLLVQDMLLLYAADGDASRIPAVRPYRDYLAWLAVRDHGAAREAWRETLAGFDDPTPLAAVDPSREITSGIGEITFTLSETDTATLTKVAHDAGVTLNTVVQAAWGLLIGRSTDRDDVVFGATVSGRPPQLAGIETMIGLFLNAIPVRVRLNAGDTLAQVLRSLQDEQAALLDHHYVGLGEIQEIAGVDGLFDSIVVFASFPVDEESLDDAAAPIDGAGILGASATNGTHYPLTVMVQPRGKGLGFGVKYLRDLFDEDAAQAIADRLAALLGRIAADPRARVAEIDALLDGERRALAEVNATEVPELQDDSTLLTLFDAQVARTPDAPAVVFDRISLTYAELDARSRRLAQELTLRGVGAESRVAVAMRRSIDLVVAVYAVLRSGGAYVPVDPDHPAERNEYVLAGSAPVCVLTRAADDFETASGVPLFFVDALAGADQFVEVAPAPVRPDNAAYVIYTSGSTGRPKGVVITHRQMANQFRWSQRTYPHRPGDVVLHKTPITFDISTWELFWPLQTGATVVVAEPDGHRDPAYIARVIDEYAITSVHFVPSMLDAYLDGAARRHPSLRWVFAAGEALSAESAAKFAAALPDTKLVNWYGPAEATVVTAHPAEHTHGVAVPIGGPVANTRVLVLDRQLRPVPFGAAGELYVAGVQLARGYLGAPALTAERFVAHENGQRLYRTGDVVRWVPSGAGHALEYLGRSDFQIKLRGQRIELGEIETVLLGHPAVHRAAVSLVRGETGDRLVAYVVLEDDTQVTDTDLLAHTRESVPSYMVPSAVVRLEAMPLNASGKLDRKALPVPQFQAREYREPATAAEQTVAEIFATVLRADRVGADDDFFELGGNSLNATQVVARLGAAIGARVPVRALFEHPTVAELANSLDALADSAVAGAAPLRPMPRPELIPLSYAQQRMWFLNRFDAAAATYNLPAALRVTGPLDVIALRAAVRDLIERHEVLRTVYPEHVGVGYQHVLDVAAADAVPALPVQAVTEADLPAAVSEAALAPFDVTAEPPLRVRLLRLAEDDHVLVCVVHHIAGDGFSMGPLTRDLMTAYFHRLRGDAPGWAPLAVQYADYTLWQREALGEESDPASPLARQIGYWRAELAGLADQLDLPADRPRPAVASGRGADVAFEIDQHVHAALNRVAQANNATLFMVVHAAYAALLARLSGTRDIAVGTAVAGRGEAELDDLIGMFVNTLVLRTDVDPAGSFTELLARTRATDLAAFEHADAPFERLVEVLEPSRSQARHPLFQAMLTFQNTGPAALELPDVAVSAVDLEVPIAKFDLQLTLTEKAGVAGGLTALFTYATDLFDAATVRGFADRFRRLLVAIASRPDVVVGDIDLLAVGERELLLEAWQLPGGSIPAATLAQLVAEQARRAPDAIAVRAGSSQLTYGELQRRANQLARALIARGAGPESLVAVAVPRTEELPVALLAVLTAGAAYLPIDTTYPRQRLEFVLSDGAPVCVLTTAAERDRLPGTDLPVVLLDEAAGFSDTMVADVERVAPLSPDQLAYVIYTSGSTGVPKGVGVTHRNVVQLFANAGPLFGFDRSDVWTLFHSFAFDFSVWELWCALATGGRVVVVDYLTSRSPEQFRELLIQEGVTVLNQTPSAFYQLIEADRAATDDREFELREVIFGGEALDLRRLRRWYDRHPDNAPRLVNMYGITETTVHVSFLALDESAAGNPASIIGRALPGLRSYVLDGRLHPAAFGVSGELYIAGDQLTRGYLGRPGLTAARFVANPFGPPGSRMYRSGDVGRWAGADPALEYAGRSDQQVQLRGFRIELGEIEAALLRCPGVSQAAVTVHRDEHVGDRLVGYVVAERGAVLDPDTVRNAVSEFLTSYMVPDVVGVLDALPLTGNGKLDRRALPAPQAAASADFRAPATGEEEAVAQVFAEVLGVDRVGADDDFFRLGGNSLVATQVVARINTALESGLGVRDLFEATTVAELARRVSTAGGRRRPPLVAGPRPELVPLSLAQQRMWFLNQFDTAATAYNIPMALRLDGALNVGALRHAVSDLVARHETLRTVYPQTGGAAHQVVLPAEQAVPELRAEPATVADLPELIGTLLATGFDVTREIPLRVRLFEVEPAVHVIVLVAHHISADGWSMGPLARDLMTAYIARSAGAAPAWTPLTVQYADYSLWQRTVLGSETDEQSLISEQAAYWRTALAGLPDELNLPADHPRPPVSSFRGGLVPFHIDAELQQGLARIAREQNATLFMVVHSALALFLARLSGTDDIAIGTPVAGRGEAALDDVIGMFVNTLVLRSHVDGGLRFHELLAATKEADLQAFAHADLPFERLVEVLNPERSTARNPLFQVMLAFQNTPDSDFELPGLRISALDSGIQTSQFDLSLTVREGDADSGLHAVFTYARDLFEQRTVEVFAERFVRLLEAIVDRPVTAIGDLPLLDADEYELLTHVHGDEVMATALLPELLTRGVALGRDRVAIRYRGHSISYGELDDYSSQLARVLIRHGVGPEKLVAVAFPRSFEMVAAVLAIAKAGGAHVPVDPAYPADRVRHMVSDSGAVIGITSKAFQPTLPGEVEWLCLDDAATDRRCAAESPEPVTDADRVAPIRMANPAYVIYTSGSTGMPKGVTVTHAGLGGLSDYATGLYDLDPEHRMLHICSPSFDPSVLEWICAFATGAALVIVPREILGGPELAELMRRENVTHAIITPAVLGTVDPAGQSQMEVVSVGGDVTPPELVAKWKTGNRVYHNAYGPTETTIISTYAQLEPGRHITIGSPVHGMSALVLDSRLNPVPPGVAGELYLSGGALARGYRNRAALSAERFVANPWGEPGSRMYRTGDVVRWFAEPELRDGNLAGTQVSWELDYVGRSDFQVKVRGFRIELGEIDAVLATHPAVEYAVTVGRKNHAGVTVLVSYVLATPGHSPDPDLLTEHAARTLPPHMVPAAILVLDELPLTPVGKLDRKALPEPELRQGEYRAPSNPLEETVAGAFAEAIGLDRVGVDDDFFAIGGNSLLATGIVAKLRERTGAEVLVSWFFTEPTVAGLSARIAAALEGEHDFDAAADSALGVLLPIRATGTRAPLFCAPPMVGMAWPYAGLSRFLPEDQPIYGLQSPALTADDYRPESLTEVARTYIEAMREVQPEGPYRLLGYSLGGVLAHAIATELRAAGDRVGLLAVLDAYPGAEFDSFREDLRAQFAEFGVGEDALPAGDLQDLSDEALHALHAAIPAELAVLTVDRLRRMYRGAVRTVELGARYRHSVLDTRMDLFSAEFGREDGEPHSVEDWRPYVTGRIAEHVVPVRHQLMCTPEAFAVIGPRLAELIERADRGDTAETAEPADNSATVDKAEPVQSAEPANNADSMNNADDWAITQVLPIIRPEDLAPPVKLHDPAEPARSVGSGPDVAVEPDVAFRPEPETAAPRYDMPAVSESGPTASRDAGAANQLGTEPDSAVDTPAIPVAPSTGRPAVPVPAASGPALSAVGEVSPLPAGAIGLLEVEPSGIWVRAITLDIAAGISGTRVRRSVAGLLDRHPGLWARLRRDGDTVALDIPAVQPRGAAVVWQIDPNVEAVGDPIEAVIHAAAAELDPERGYNMRFVLLENGAADGDAGDHPAAVLVVVANGLVVDDASWRTVIEDLTASWSGGHATPHSADAHPRGVARALADRAVDDATVDELDWWRQALAGVTEGISPDLVLGEADSGSRGRVSVAITGEGAAAVDAVARRYHASIDEVLLAALAATLLDPDSEALRDTLGSVVRLIADGRVPGDRDGLRTVGAFSTSYPFPLRLEGLDLAEVRSGGPGAGSVIEQIRDFAREVPSHGVGFGLLRYLNPDTVAEIAVLPLGRIGFRYRDLRPAEVYPEPVAADLYLDVTVDTSQDGLVARFDFVGAVLTLDQVKQLVEGWVQALAGLADHGR
ncbi:amino acid adenylation domain-containing protein [Nocardia sp. NPDC004151]|uniref:amino acid adenylation domain-containing protein n=1 Tax=Nocardia sp. NPDC004151 TaxID=3364304 RepID=UPI0036944997